MSKHYLIKEQTLVDIADAIREKTGGQEEILVGELSERIGEIAGADTSDATATTGDILSGKTAYVNGEKITGTIETVIQATPDIVVDLSTGLITATTNQVAGYIEAGTKSATEQLPKETWIMTLEDGSTVTKEVIISD